MNRSQSRSQSQAQTRAQTRSQARIARGLVVTTALAASAMCLLPVSAASAATAAVAPAAASAAPAPAASTADVAAATAALAATPWETTGAVDQDGNAVPLTDPRAASFVGNAYFKADGTFTMFELNDAPKMQGDWEMREVDGQLVRWIAAKNPDGTVRFQRIVPITELNGSVFTYRVVDANDASKWVDIVHTPTDHVEPGTVDVAAATAALAATPWETTGAVDQDGNAVPLTDPRAASFVGNAYFKADGTFKMFELNDAPKMQGDWEMREVDGQLVRWIAAKNPDGSVRFQRIVPITELNGSVFTYRVVDANDASKWVDIVHTPTDHVEPGSSETPGGETETPGEGTPGGEIETPGAGGTGGSDGTDAPGVGAGSGTGAGSGMGEAGGSAADKAPGRGATSGANTVTGKGGKGHLAETGGSANLAALIGGAVTVVGGAALAVARRLRGSVG